MVLFNYSTKELTAKIVFYGPGLCGKTTNLQFVYDNLPKEVQRGKMLSLATKTDRTLFFDFLPLDLGTIRGMKTRLQLYTVPGQVFYNSTRKMVLKGADGVVFVADSQAKMLDANVESFANLEENLAEQGLKLEQIPHVLQFNKRDLPGLGSIEDLNTALNKYNAPFYEAIAINGIGVHDTLKAITKLVLNNLATKYKIDGAATTAEPEPASRPTAAARPAPRPAPPPPSESPEDLALDGLQDSPSLASPPPRAAARRGLPVSPAPMEEVFDLEEEIDLPDLTEPEGDSMIDLGEDLLQELEDESIPLAAVPAASSPGRRPASGISLRAVPQPAAEEDLIDLDAPLDLEEWDAEAPAAPGAAAAAQAPIDIGALAPGEERVVEIPVTASVGGRSMRLSLRVTVRLSR